MRIGFIEERARRVLLMDFSDLRDGPAILSQIDEARRFVLKQPRRKELLTLVDVTGMRYDADILQAFQALARHDEPWERAVAVCGLGGVGRVAFRATNLLTGSRMQGFKKRAEALDWLASQAS